MLEFWSYAFMQRAFHAGFVVAILCPTIGIFLVLRRLSMIGEMFAHVSLAGVALGIFTGTYPLASALGLSLVAAGGLEALRRTYRIFGDLAIAIMISVGISLAVVLISLSQAFNADLFSYLFGSVIAISRADLFLIRVIGVAVLLFVFLMHKELFFIAFDEEAARASGVRVDLVNMLFVAATALTIAVAMRVVGILLVSSLITVPVAAGLQVGKSFRATILYSYLFALTSVLLGLVVAYYADLAPGGSIVLIAVGLFVAAALCRRLMGIGGKKFVNTATVETFEREGL
ncbi:metal ABC transporter permease [Dethiobacter alkaliphilus]|uniref:ABC-3 protein n=1 Tax=Dethiobacter alkaliphilus AHT 1 TaxID=555088 RepID=C0GJ60_DETAL|nr:metal ABC transporter permease [Dethiobacter alkaliphilus]EEG76693.1 ABC-3 protein [Dethiobacter alkaliphilus AHT 1]